MQMMTHRVLLESFKFISVREVYCTLTQVCRDWEFLCVSPELLAHFLQDEDTPSDPSLTLYQRLQKYHRTIDKSHFLLHMCNAMAHVWDVRVPEEKPKTYASETFVNSARYTMISKTEAIITGGVTQERTATLFHLVFGTTSPLPDLKEERAWHGTIYLQGCVYIAGGEVKGAVLKSAEVYDGIKWSRIANMTIGRYNLTLSTFKKQVYAFGGSEQVYLKTIEYYNGVEWKLAPMELPTPRNYPTIVRARNTLILISGYEPRATQRSIHIWEDSEMCWREVGACPAQYSLSNAASLKRNAVLFFFNYKPNELAMDLS